MPNQLDSQEYISVNIQVTKSLFREWAFQMLMQYADHNDFDALSNLYAYRHDTALSL